MDNVFLTDAGIRDVAKLFEAFPKPSALAQGPSEPQLVPQWYSAFLSGDFSGALQELEAKLGRQQHDLELSEHELRLWWICCQLAMDAVPVSALSAPLEDISEYVQQNSDFITLGAVTSVRVAIKCLEKNQLRLGVILLERALELVIKDTTSTDKQCSNLVELLCLAIQDELRRAQVRRESKEYVAALKEKFGKYSNPKYISSLRPEKELQQPSKAAPTTQSKERTAVKRRVFTSKSIIEQAIVAPDKNTSVHCDTANTKPKDDSPELTFKELTAEEVSSEKDALEKVMIMGERTQPDTAASRNMSTTKELSYFVKTSACLVTLGVLSYVFLWRSSFHAFDRFEEVGERLAFNIDTTALPEQILPVVERRLDALAPDGSAPHNLLSLEEVKQRLDSLGTRRKEREATQTVSLETLQNNPDVDTNALKAGAQLLKSSTTSSPRETNAAVQPTFGSSQDDNKKMPDLTSEHLEKTEQRSLDPQALGTEEHPELHQEAGVLLGGDIQRHGAHTRELDSHHISAITEARLPPVIHSQAGTPLALDGTPLRAYPVEHFNDPLSYLVIATTDVYSSPSILAQPVEHLEQGDKIDVIGQLGPWLELRSARGRRGYIYAQNAVREEGR